MDTKTAQKQLVSLITEHLSDSIPVTRILTYKPSSSGAVTGRFESSGRVYNFMFNGVEARYKPAMNADSALFSDYYLERFDAAPRVASGKPRALPKCTSKSYSCKGQKGVACIPLTNHCKMANTAIGNERLGKIKSMSKFLAANGEDTTKTEATRAKIVEGRMALAVENRAKRTPKSLAKAVEVAPVKTAKVATTKKNVAKPKTEKVVKTKKEIIESDQGIEVKPVPKFKETLGEGTFAKVHLTESNTAFKEFKEFGFDVPDTRSDEVQFAKEMEKLGVGVKVLSVSKKDGKIIGYEMEAIKGSDNPKPETTNYAVSVDVEDARGEPTLLHMAKLHLNGLAHNDLHDGNIMVTSKGDTKFIDAGCMSKGNKEDILLEAACMCYAGSKNKHPQGSIGYKLFEVVHDLYKKRKEIKENYSGGEQKALYDQLHDEYVSKLKDLVK